MSSFATASMRSSCYCDNNMRFMEKSNNYENFNITELYFKNGFTVAHINYPDSDNPNKILVFVGDKRRYLKNAVSIDPHFNEKQMDNYKDRLVFRVKDSGIGRKILENILEIGYYGKEV